jgi:hypothetical protein
MPHGKRGIIRYLSDDFRRAPDTYPTYQKNYPMIIPRKKQSVTRFYVWFFVVNGERFKLLSAKAV